MGWWHAHVCKQPCISSASPISTNVIDLRSPDLAPHLFESLQDIILLLSILLLYHVILMKMRCLIVKLGGSKTSIIILPFGFFVFRFRDGDGRGHFCNALEGG